MRKCDSCGKVYQESKDVFCPHCGAVAQKQCTHGSSFDSKRYDRGEIYKSKTPSYQNTTYNQTSEPHAQRNSLPYNKPEKDDFGEKIPKINLPDITKTFTNGKGKTGNSKYIGIIIFVLVFAFNIITVMLSDPNDIDDTDYWVDYEDVSMMPENEPDFYAVSSGATVNLFSETGMEKDIEISIDEICFSYEDSDSYAELQKYLSEEGLFTEINVCTFAGATVSESDYNNALIESYYISSNYSDKPGNYRFTCDFDYDEIVYLIGGVCIYIDDETCLNIELPFDAFSVSEDGEVTYYNSYADDTTAWNTVFSECSNEQSVDSDFVIDFSIGE